MTPYYHISLGDHVWCIFYLPSPCHTFLKLLSLRGFQSIPTTPHCSVKLSFHVSPHFGYCVLIGTVVVSGVLKHLSSEAKLCDFKCSWSSLEMIVTWGGEPYWTLCGIFPLFLSYARYWFGKCLYYALTSKWIP